MAKNPPASAGDMGSIPGLGRSPEEENGNPRQYSCLGNPTDREAWQTTVLGVSKESGATKQLNNKVLPTAGRVQFCRVNPLASSQERLEG